MSTGSATRPVHVPVAVEQEREDPPPHLNRPGGGPPRPQSGEPPISNAKMGMLMLIGAETMFFAGLIGAYLVFRFGTTVWPSAHLYLPVAITWANSVVLASSCYTMYKATNCFKSADLEAFLSFLWFTVCLGTIFLCVQGYEWIQLVHDGLTISAGAGAKANNISQRNRKRHVEKEIAELNDPLVEARLQLVEVQMHLVLM